jgi:predicted Rossmann fold flavoprotein
MTKRRIITVGGGAAGYFGAIHAARANPGLQVLILERGKRVLDKVRISGGGRCNVTHACFDPRELVKYYPRGSKELLGPFHRFATGDTVGWFADEGVELKIEEDGRMFPVTDDSMTIINCLQRAAERAGVRLQTRAMVKRIDPPRHPGDAWRLHTNQGEFYADVLYLTTGSNPSCWKMLAEIGHHIVDPVPSLFTLNTKDTRLRDLSGISVPWARVLVPTASLQAEGPLLIRVVRG